jgi:hypothetical protein
MTMLSEMIGLRIIPETKKRNKAMSETLSAPIRAKSEKPHDKYEAAVFNFLLNNREVLGIKSVSKYTALLVDGAVELIDGRRLTIEIKFRMNWTKACQAEYQFRNFLKRHAYAHPATGGIVFFEEFSGDWDRQPKCRHWKNGWNHWYQSHSEVDGFHVDLLRLQKDKLEGFPLARREDSKSTFEEITKAISQLPPDQLAQIRASLAEYECLKEEEYDDSPWTREELQALAWETGKSLEWEDIDEYDDAPEKP